MSFIPHAKAEFSASITPIFSHVILQKSLYGDLLLNIFFYESSKEQHLFETETFSFF